MSPALLLARDSCIRDPVIIILLILANAGIAASYIWIPLSIYRVGRALSRLPAPPFWFLFPAFILSCAATHACAVLVMFRPAWYLEAALCLGTAAISGATAATLHFYVPRLRKLLLGAERLRAEVERDAD